MCKHAGRAHAGALAARLWAPLLIAVAGCGDDVSAVDPAGADLSALETPEAVAPDARVPEGAPFERSKCEPVHCSRGLCRVTGTAPTTVEHADVELCTCQLLPETPSAGLYKVCLVGPDGSLYRTWMGGSVAIMSEGFRHSGYSALNPSTLSGDDAARCDAAFSSGESLDSGVCPGL